MAYVDGSQQEEVVLEEEEIDPQCTWLWHATADVAATAAAASAVAAAAKWEFKQEGEVKEVKY